MAPGKGKKGKGRGRGQAQPASEPQQPQIGAQPPAPIPRAAAQPPAPVPRAAVQPPAPISRAEAQPSAPVPKAEMTPGKGRGKGRGQTKPSHEPQQPQIGAQPPAPVPRGEVQQLAVSQQRPQAASRPIASQVQTPLPSIAPAVAGIQTQQLAVSQPQQVQASGGDIKKTALQEIIEKLYAVHLPRNFAKRPDEPATKGRPIELISNCYEVNVKSGIIFHYDVEITPHGQKEKEVQKTSDPHKEKKKYRGLSNKLNRRVINIFIQAHKEDLFRNIIPVYDGRKNLLTNRPLKIDSQKSLKTSVVLKDDDGRRDQTFEIAVQFAAEINLEKLYALYRKRTTTVPQDAIMALDIIFRHGPSLTLTQIGRSFYIPPVNPQDVHPLGGGKEVWFGYYQSLRPGQWKPILVIDKANTVFHSPMPILDYVGEILGRSPDSIQYFSDSDVKRLSSELKGLFVRVTHQPNRRKYRVVRVTRERASELKFDLKQNDGRIVKTTVANYFQSQYNKRLSYPNLPCLQMHPETRTIFMPLEVCEIVEGQHYKKKLNDRQTSDMIKVTAVEPERRFREIDKSAKMHVDKSRPYLQEFGIDVNLRPMQVQGRVLEAPNLLYDKQQKIKPFNGAWNLQNQKFLEGATINSWVMLCFDNRCAQQALSKFAQMLVEQGSQLGMKIRPAALIDYRRPDRRDSSWVYKALKECQDKYKAELAVVILEKKDAFYREVKQAGDVKIGLITQCALQFNISRKLNVQYVGNILQKINAKMGGQNNSIIQAERPKILDKPVIIIGVDVTHPAPSEHSKPSIAAAVGSVDAKLSRFTPCVQIQQAKGKMQSRVELIEEFHVMVKELLKAFYRNCKYKPEKIIIYRDGVSEGQFVDVRDHELKAARRACMELQSDYEPGITFIVVQKRHHTRFRPANMQEGVGKCKNIPPGTAIDTAVTHPVDFDFYLCSHFGIQGTSRPSHYYVLWDDNNFSADELQKLTYHLCHVYARCTRTISAPAPVCYADLVAYHARHHLANDEDLSSAASSFSEEEIPLTESILNSVRVADNLKSSMYYV